MTTTPTQHATAIAAAIAAFHAGGSQSALASALATALEAYDDVGGLAERIEALITENATIIDSLLLFTPKGTVDLVSNLPTGEALGAFYIVTSGEFAGHGYVLSAGGWEDLGLVRGASAYQVWRDQPGNSGKTEAEYLTWLANAQIEAVTDAVQPLVDDAEAAATAAAGSASTASTKAGEASTSATAAATARTAAQTAQGLAEDARDDAQAAATAASGSAGTATTKAGEASTSATAAASARTAAQTAQGLAEDARDDAQAAATAASGSAGAATTKAGEASTSATAAAAAKAAAETAQGLAEDARDDAQAAATAASGSAGTATTKAGEASTSATAAAAARAAAEAARDAAEAIVGGDFIARPGGTTLSGKVAIFTAADGGTVEGRPIGSATATDILDRQTGDARFQPLNAALTNLATANWSSTTTGRLTSVAGTSSTGFMVQGSSSSLNARRTLTSADAGIAITNGNGVSGNPVFTLGRATEAQGIAGTDNLLAMTALSTKAAVDAAITALNYTTSPIAASRLTGVIDTANLPAVVINDTFEVGSQAAMLALTAQRGDIAIRTDENRTYVLSTDSPSTLADWKWMRTPTDLVLSVAGLTGAITQAALKTALAMGISDVSGLATALAGKQAASEVLADLAALTGGAVGQTIKKTADGFEFGDGGGVGVEIGDTFFSNRSTFPAGIVPADGATYLASSYSAAAAIFPPVFGAAPTATTATGSSSLGGSYAGNASLSAANGRLFLSGASLYGNVLLEITSLSPYTTRTINIGATGAVGPVAYAFGKYISADFNYFRHSATGLTGEWTQGTALNASVYAFAYGNGVLLAATSDGMWRTTDGVSWTKVTAWGSNTLPHGVAFANGYFMAFYSGSGSGMRSADGLTWASTTSPSVAPQGLVWEANGYFVIGDSVTLGRFRYSTDALTWSSVDVGGTTGDSQAMIHAGGLYCALKSYSLHIASSITGPWTELSNTDANVMNRLVYGLGAFVAPQRYDYYSVRYAPYAPASPAQFYVPSVAAIGTGAAKAKAYSRIA
ncbi:hypothetical protein CA606_18565 [Caulobacter vibrioides]|uniref:Uncharacterized protein n=1 Tax=Caulobacter vibrioides TaxID=155892 RepID=A0A290N368_CAUVI|nr:hypothetical protein [Caulobacter vibrioides]ATC34174.1 hypothetical protein CA606_18565 [Caulobacter vibrioides]